MRGERRGWGRAMSFGGLFEDFWLELAKSFAYGAILAAVGHVIVMFWHSLRGGMAAIPRLRQQISELFRIRRDHESGHTAFGPWLILRDLIRIAVFVAATVAIGLLVSELLVRLAATDQTLRGLDKWGTITLRTQPIPVPVFAVSFLAAFFLAYHPTTGRIIAALAIAFGGGAILVVLILLCRFLPFETGQAEFQLFHDAAGGLSASALNFDASGGNWFTPSLHVALVSAAFLVSLMATFIILRSCMTFLPEIWQRALSGSTLPAWSAFGVAAFCLFLLYALMSMHFHILEDRFGLESGTLDWPRIGAFVVSIPLCLWMAGSMGGSLMKKFGSTR